MGKTHVHLSRIEQVATEDFVEVRCGEDFRAVAAAREGGFEGAGEEACAVCG